MISFAKFLSIKNKRLSVINVFHLVLVKKLVASLEQIDKEFIFYKLIIFVKRATQESNKLLN